MTLACLAQEVELPDAFRRIRLSICPGDLGLSCSETGLRLAETPLLRKLGDGFEPRPVAERPYERRLWCGYRFNPAHAGLGGDREGAQRRRSSASHDRCDAA